MQGCFTDFMKHNVIFDSNAKNALQDSGTMNCRLTKPDSVEAVLDYDKEQWEAIIEGQLNKLLEIKEKMNRKKRNKIMFEYLDFCMFEKTE